MHICVENSVKYMLRKWILKFALVENIFKLNTEKKIIVVRSFSNVYNFMCLLVAKETTNILAVNFLEKKLQWVKRWER